MMKNFCKLRVGYYIFMTIIYTLFWQIYELIFPSFGFELVCMLMGGTIIGEQIYNSKKKDK